MTKTIIAVGLGLLAAIFSPAKAVLATDTVFIAQGGAKESVSLLFSLHSSPTVDACSAELPSVLEPLDGFNMEPKPFTPQLNLANPFFGMTHKFAPGDDKTRQTVRVRAVGGAKFDVSGAGHCYVWIHRWQHLTKDGTTTDTTDPACVDASSASTTDCPIDSGGGSGGGAYGD